MDSFYEVEMPELDDDTEDLVQSNEAQQRRDIKQDPKDKAKERLWASIVDQAENESDSDSDD